MNAIEAERLTKVFAGGVEAVAGIDLAVLDGEIFAFLGPNGAGKSTTIRILTTLLKPTAGRARVAGVDVVTHPHEVRRRIGVALQEAGLDQMATGRELLRLQGMLHGFSRGEARRQADRLLEMMSLTDAADRLVKTYSGGMKRRLDLASALIHGPRILFLDEPTAGLDPASRRVMWEEVRTLRDRDGITVFLTTQYLEEADQLADRVAIIDHGRIVTEGTPQSLKSSVGSDVVTVSVGVDVLERARNALEGLDGLTELKVDRTGLTLFVSDGSNVVARVIKMLDVAAVDVGAVSVSTPTLDEVFLRATGSRLEGGAPPEQRDETR